MTGASNDRCPGREGRCPLVIAPDGEKENSMKKIALVRSYGRYVLSALAAVAFGLDSQ